MHTHRESKSIALTMRNLRSDRYLRGHASNNRYRLALECWAINEHGMFVAALCVPVIYQRICNIYGAMRARRPARFLQSVLLQPFDKSETIMQKVGQIKKLNSFPQHLTRSTFCLSLARSFSSSYYHSSRHVSRELRVVAFLSFTLSFFFVRLFPPVVVIQAETRDATVGTADFFFRICQMNGG